MNTNKEEQILRRHLKDLANTSYYRGICVFSDFLNLNEQNIFLSMKNELPAVPYYLYGGYSNAERKMICFCGDERISKQEEVTFPITCIQIKPRNKKFSDNLTHRDFLGAVLNLGIDRSKVGDILIEENKGYLLCIPSISSFITDNLIKIKHTMVDTSIIDQNDFHYEPKLKEITGTVSSIRLDSILSIAFRRSRSSLSGLIEGGKVYVNSKEVLSNSYELKENDVISVRGYGKFIYAGTSYKTKKGRYSIKVLLYT
ncbi:MAG: RNA-binding protein [Clostridiales bacterium]|nr:RNA-binding protein [Clostridiales bacterium]